MMIELSIQVLQKHFEELIKSNLSVSAPHSREFVRRILGSEYKSLYRSDPQNGISASIDYGGYPALAGFGFRLSQDPHNQNEMKDRFLDGLRRLRMRTAKSLEAFFADDVAILGVAEGLSIIASDDSSPSPTSDLSDWLVSIVDKQSGKPSWSTRLRHLAGDILDSRGRLQAPLQGTHIMDLSLELVLRYSWADQYRDISVPKWSEYQKLFESLMKSSEQINDVETAAIRLVSLNLLFTQSCGRLFPRTDREQLGSKIIQAVLARLNRRVLRESQVLTSVIALTVGSFAFWIVMITSERGWDFTEPRTYLIGIFLVVISWFYLAITGRELSPQAFYDAILRYRRRRIYRVSGIDAEDVKLYQGIDKNGT